MLVEVIDVGELAIVLGNKLDFIVKYLIMLTFVAVFLDIGLVKAK